MLLNGGMGDGKETQESSDRKLTRVTGAEAGSAPAKGRGRAKER